jgi:hypothetical protein
MLRALKRWTAIGALALFAAAAVAAFGTGSASAHGFSSAVYVHLTAPEKGHVRAELGLEYDLLVVSAADTQHDDQLFKTGTAAFESGDSRQQAGALDAHADTIVKYVAERFIISSSDGTCLPKKAGPVTIGERDGVPYAFLTLDETCSGTAGRYEVTSRLFPDSETYVRGTKTIATYEIQGLSGSAALDSAHPSFSTGQSWTSRFWEFFRLGAEHLLTGLDHCLFLLALIAGSRRLREIVLVATAFTVAHSVSFMLAAFGVVKVSPRVVEPTIALSIAVVAGWYLWRVLRRGEHATDLDVGPHARGGHFSLDRAGWTRLGVVFCFGLVHGLGFAGALGIDGAWSWTLLWSLLVFNIGIETVQIGIIIVVFPLLILLRRRSPRLGLWFTGALAAAVSVVGLVWFVQRLAGT